MMSQPWHHSLSPGPGARSAPRLPGWKQLALSCGTVWLWQEHFCQGLASAFACAAVPRTGNSPGAAELAFSPACGRERLPQNRKGHQDPISRGELPTTWRLGVLMEDLFPLGTSAWSEHWQSLMRGWWRTQRLTRALCRAGAMELGKVTERPHEALDIVGNLGGPKRCVESWTGTQFHKEFLAQLGRNSTEWCRAQQAGKPQGTSGNLWGQEKR